MNSFSAVGRIGRDAVVRSTSAGKAVTGWALAVDSGFGDAKQTVWLDCSLWGDRGPKIADYIKKGERLGVTGEIGMREHNGKSYVTLNVRDVTLLGDSKGAAKSTSAKPRAPQTQAADSFEDDTVPF